MELFKSLLARFEEVYKIVMKFGAREVALPLLFWAFSLEIIFDKGEDPHVRVALALSGVALLIVACFIIGWKYAKDSEKSQ